MLLELVLITLHIVLIINNRLFAGVVVVIGSLQQFLIL